MKTGPDSDLPGKIAQISWKLAQAAQISEGSLSRQPRSFRKTFPDNSDLLGKHARKTYPDRPGLLGKPAQIAQIF